uniref:Uncharacterized protein n=2 Tax=Bursaphelenchus xylophilus TaxID=6326 RepID=A0A1I7SGG5_BURXY
MLLRWSTVLLLSLFLHTAISSTSKKSKRQNNERSDKVLLRTKRQHCTCLNVRIGTSDQPPVGPGFDALASTYKCTCNSAGNPMQQQRELQQILQQVEPMSRCLCGPGSQFAREPAMGPLYEQLPEQQQWECHCQHGNEPIGPAPQFFPWNRPTASQPSPLIPTRAPQLAPTYPTFPLLPRQDQPIAPHIAPSVSPAPLPVNTHAPVAPLPVNRDSRPYDAPPPYPEQPNGINTPIAPIRRPEPARPLPIASCPCMEVTVNVIRTDSRGNRVPIRTPMCLCEPVAPAASIAPVAPLKEAPVLQPIAPVAPALPSPVTSYSATTNMLPIVGAHPGQTLFYPDGHLVPPNAPVPLATASAPLPVLPAAPLLVNDEPVA